MRNNICSLEHILANSIMVNQFVILKLVLVEDIGFSLHTGLHLTSRRYKSIIYGHFSKTGHEILPGYFEVQTVKQQNELKIAESMDTHRFKSTLNDMVTSVALNILI